MKRGQMKRGQIYFRLPSRRSRFPATLSSPPPTGFALHGESLSLVWPRESNQREGHPGIRVWPAARLPSLRRCSGGRLTRAILGPLSLSPHPCGSFPYATPPLGLLTRIGVRVARRFERHLSVFFCRVSSDTNRPFRRVSGIAVEGVERHGCRESRGGPGMALRGVPLERRWSERTRSEAQGRMAGQAFLVTFVATDKSDPPSRAEQKFRP